MNPGETDGNAAGKKGRKKEASPEQRARRAEIKAMQQKRDESKRTKDTIMGLVMIAIGAFIFVSVQFHAAGEFGNQLGTILKGFFGLFGWLFPWYLVIMGILFMTHRAVHVSKRALLLLFVLLLFLCSLNSARFIDSSNLKFTIDRFYQDGTTLDGGGLFGMIFGTLIVKLLGKAGLIIFSILFIVICLFLLLNTPLTRWIADVKDKLEEKRLISAMEAARRQEELREMEEAVEEERRAEKVRRWEELTNGEVVSAAEPASPAGSYYYDEKPLSEAERRKLDKRSSAKTMDFGDQLDGMDLFTKNAGKRKKSNVFDFMKNHDPFADSRGSGESSYGLEQTGPADPAGAADAGVDTAERADFPADETKEVRPSVKISGYGLDDQKEAAPGYGLGESDAGTPGYGPEGPVAASSGYGLEESGSAPAGFGLDGGDRSAPSGGFGLEESRSVPSGFGLDGGTPEPAAEGSPEAPQDTGASQVRDPDDPDPGADIYRDLYSAFERTSDTPADDPFDLFGTGGNADPVSEDEGAPDDTGYSVDSGDSDDPFGLFGNDTEPAVDPSEDTIDLSGYLDGDEPPVFTDFKGTAAPEGTEEGFSEAAADKPAFSVKKPKLDAQTAARTASEAAAGLRTESEVRIHYQKPAIDLLDEPVRPDTTGLDRELREKAQVLEDTMQSFNVDARVTQVTKGPSVTRYEVHPGTGVKVSRIVQLADDIALNLRAKNIRIEAPIPGKAAVGIEVENEKVNMVKIREIIDSSAFKEEESKIAFALGKDIAGNSIVADLKGMPHLLIAGSTGSGKSVCINSIITSIMYRADPSEVKLVLIDPKVVELGDYNGIPHLLIPVVTDPAKATAALAWAVVEMTNRYKIFAETSSRDITGYNKKMRSEGMEDSVMPQVVIIIDELADLMMAASKQVEESIVRLAQLARAAGMHLIVATQRPSVDIITGLIKANIPSRIAFAVSSSHDSKTILDMGGAEHLVGKGDMLFKPLGKGKPLRVQGTFISDEEIRRVIDFVKGQNLAPEKADDVIEMIETGSSFGQGGEGTDDLLPEAIDFVVDSGKASTSMLQRRFRIGYNRAASIMDMMEERGIVTPQDGSRPRQILVTKEDLEPGGEAPHLDAAQ